MPVGFHYRIILFQYCQAMTAATLHAKIQKVFNIKVNDIKVSSKCPLHCPFFSSIAGFLSFIPCHLGERKNPLSFTFNYISISNLFRSFCVSDLQFHKTEANAEWSYLYFCFSLSSSLFVVVEQLTYRNQRRSNSITVFHHCTVYVM